jgi:diguanylate cyclase (GGDEF)-like protein
MLRCALTHGGVFMDTESYSPAPVPAPPVLHTLVFDSLHEQIAVIDHRGTIVDVNSAWIRFGVENGMSADYDWLGINYLDVLTNSHCRGDENAGDAAQGILDVLDDRRASFDIEYPCRGPDAERWFVMRATRLRTASRRLVAISHYDVTARKVAEQRAEYLALHDPLTGMANRRHFNATVERVFRASLRNRSPVSLIAIDVDHFKDYNDECGHPAGDDCLAHVGQAIRAFARRPNDLAARIGGDEFAVLLGDTDLAQSQRLAQAIRTSVTDLRIVYGSARQVTISAGVASVIPHHLDESDEHLLREADDALYRAKQAGRNRVVPEDEDSVAD